MNRYELNPAALRSQRNARGLSREQLCAAAAVSYSSLLRYENGSSQPPVAAALRLAEALGVPLEELVGAREATGAAA